ncbi:hypothetical protein HanIR_Chr12g0581461 [Helianthus annuus]|nr:hypothetical protein HanIR_Chr12g0581461 [Helianthus annuus]
MRSLTVVASFLTIFFALALISSMMTVAQERVGVAPPPPLTASPPPPNPPLGPPQYGSWRCWGDTQCR